jgi:hypothetical protein
MGLLLLSNVPNIILGHFTTALFGSILPPDVSLTKSAEDVHELTKFVLRVIAFADIVSICADSRKVLKGSREIGKTSQRK